MAGTRDRYWETTFQTREADRRWRQDEGRRRALAPGENPCPGGCNAQWRKQQKLLDAYEQALKAWEADPKGEPPKEPETRPLSPLPGDPVFCAQDVAILKRLLKELDDLACIVARDADGHRKGPDAERVSGTKRSTSTSPTAEDLDELASVLRGWEAVARGDDDTPPRRGWLATEITTVTNWLYHHFDELICNRDVATDFATEIREWHKRLMETGKAGTGRRQMNKPCPRCQRYSLTREDGAEYIACQTPSCGRLMSVDEWDQGYDYWTPADRHAG